MICIKDLREHYQYCFSDALIRQTIKRINIPAIIENKLQQITEFDAQLLLQELNHKHTVFFYKDVADGLSEEQQERKKLFMQKYGKHTEKWFDPKWWPTKEDITPAEFAEEKAE
jgi:hypothetical protein